MTEFDKYKWCKNPKTGEHCPDRVGGCHDDCDGYKARCQEQAERKRYLKSKTKIPTAHYEKAKIDVIKRYKKNRGRN